jgi:hypothetical protein
LPEKSIDGRSGDVMSPAATLQRYVSRELTHFVGRGPHGPKPLEEQYATLLSILTSGWLSGDFNNPGKPRPIEINGFKKVCEADVFDTRPVCFCDIPVEDFGIHMAKYGSIGLSFLKSFLVPQGASPAFYVAKDSLAELDFRTGEPALKSTRGALFNEQVHSLLGLHVQRLLWKDQRRHFPDDCGELVDHINALSHPMWFLYYHVFGHIKCFSSSLDEDHQQNFYMEREWRMVRDLKFEVRDVWRVILPRELVCRFRSDVRDYNGQITFSE